ncbi:MAG: anhydro-N-acetylmuramic acid kinase [Candidatus Omnitrophica bacterium]|nr:anhydro-N-acetylmuramic acid kinase [Candidatus Omnitrophota bacterium]
MSPLALGLMSGTSCDGISAALVSFRGKTLRLLAQRSVSYPQRIVQLLHRSTQLNAPVFSSLNMELGEHFAKAALSLLRGSRIPPSRVSVIGSHGHTIYHGPDDPVPSTLQIGEPSIIAHRTGIPVVANFRPRDIAAGGSGAPLIPYFDEMFFGASKVRALQNIGGIANVTVVGSDIRTLAFDTGPGNCLMDSIVRKISRGKMLYDARGHLALRGRIDHRAIGRLGQHPYFRKPPPKSTGRELFNEALLRQVFGSTLERHPLDVLATTTYFTAHSIVDSYRRFVPHRIKEVIVSGGGVRNRTLMDHLTRLLHPTLVFPIERYGIPAQAKEPIAFAYLALRTFQGKINHLPDTTGAKSAAILGAIYPGKNVNAFTRKRVHA